MVVFSWERSRQRAGGGWLGTMQEGRREQKPGPREACWTWGSQCPTQPHFFSFPLLLMVALPSCSSPEHQIPRAQIIVSFVILSQNCKKTGGESLPLAPKGTGWRELWGQGSQEFPPFLILLLEQDEAGATGRMMEPRGGSASSCHSLGVRFPRVLLCLQLED